MYEKFLKTLQFEEEENKGKILDKICTNFSGMIAYAELEDKEYRIIKEILYFLDKTLN